jgi:DNA (cytosine-5)-methyltransferase 1
MFLKKSSKNSLINYNIIKYLAGMRGGNLSEVIRYDLALPVYVRKYEVDTNKLVLLLRSAKKESGLTNRKIADILKRPITEVEHWFRTDNCFSIPDPNIWYKLKSLLGIKTNEFDAPITEFIEKDGVFEKANRIYDINGIAPTLTVASADEKIIVESEFQSTYKPKEGGKLTEIMKIGYVESDKQQNRVHLINGIMPTITANNQGGRRPGGLIIEFENDQNLKGVDKLKTNFNEIFEGKPFTYVSLFSGVGGFEQALNKLGGKCVMASEIDKYANIAYETLYGHKTVGDITKVKAEDVPDHSLLVAGFPCQAFSVAGKRLGFEDTRGTLFFEIIRIAKVKRPKVMLLENVKGLVNHDKGKTLNTIIQTLCDIGYTIDFEVLNSKYFGVPQNRERVFIVAIRDDLITPEPWKIEGNNVVAKGKRRIAKLNGIKTFNFDWPEQTEVTTRLRDILEDNVDERFYLSEEKTAKLVAQLNDKEHELISEETAHDGYNGKIYADGKVTPTLTRNCGYGFRNGVNIIEPQMLGHIDLKGHDAIKRVYSTEGVSPTLTTMGGGHREPKIAVEFNRKDGIGKELDVAHTVNHSDWRGLNRNQNQNAVIEEVRPVLTPDRENKRQEGRRFKENDDPAFTLNTQDRHGVAFVYRELVEKDIRDIVAKTRPNENIEITFKKNGDIRPHRTDAKKSGISELNINHENNPSFTVTSSHAPKIYGETTRYRIRKLTPRECFRLQGFPDSEFDKLVEAGISNSQLYKLAGNAVTVNVIEEIGKRLLNYF